MLVGDRRSRGKKGEQWRVSEGEEVGANTMNVVPDGS